MRTNIIIIAIGILLIFILPLAAEDTAVAKLSYDSDKWIALHLLLQAQGQFSEYYNKDADGRKDTLVDKSFYLRRSRLIVNGEAAKNVGFFLETEDLNAGKDSTQKKGSDGTGMYTQSAFINYTIATELEIAVGMIPLPFMHHGRESAASLLGIDYATNFAGTGLQFTNVWRDYGIEMRGLLANGHIDYRFGVFQGRKRAQYLDSTDPNMAINEHASLRYCGRVQINILDAETGFFYSGNYLGKKKIISFGGGMDYQQNVIVTNGAKEDFMAWTIDATVDFGYGNGHSFVLQAGYINVTDCPETNTWSASNTRTYRNSSGFFIQTGFLIANLVQPVIKYYQIEKENAAKWDSTGTTESGSANIMTSHISGGINFFINGHNANIKAEFQYPLDSSKESVSEKTATLQFQIFL